MLHHFHRFRDAVSSYVLRQIDHTATQCTYNARLVLTAVRLKGTVQVFSEVVIEMNSERIFRKNKINGVTTGVKSIAKTTVGLYVIGYTLCFEYVFYDKVN